MRTAFHITLTSSLKSIRTRGLLGRYARGKRQAVWVVREADVLWAIAHTMCKSWAKGQKLAIIKVDVRGLRLLRHSSERCLWIRGDVPPDRIEVTCSDVGRKVLS